MDSIAIHSRTFTPERLPVFLDIIKQVEAYAAEPILSAQLYRYMQKHGKQIKHLRTFKEGRELEGCRLVISAGGDGTMLETITFVGSLNIPILGVNTGRLGFLATTTRENIRNAIAAYFAGAYTLDARTLIQLHSDQDIFEGINFGLNEFTILKRDSSSMILVHTFINGQKLNAYWADGLIIATPTGSTGYSLSVGGPVVMPDCNNFVISPVSPHNLNVRPLIVSDESIISFQIESRSKSFLVSLDSRSKKVAVGVKLMVKKCDFKVNLVKLEHQSFLDTLRRKLNWGMDLRN